MVLYCKLRHNLWHENRKIQCKQGVSTALLW